MRLGRLKRSEELAIESGQRIDDFRRRRFEGLPEACRYLQCFGQIDVFQASNRVLHQSGCGQCRDHAIVGPLRITLDDVVE